MFRGSRFVFETMTSKCETTAGKKPQKGDEEHVFVLHPGKLTCPLKRDYFSRECIFQPLIFRGHVSFQGSIYPSIFAVTFSIPQVLLVSSGSIGSFVFFKCLALLGARCSPFSWTRFGFLERVGLEFDAVTIPPNGNFPLNKP